jgi:hypothetical protein
LTTFNRDINFTEEITVTPADYTTVVWYLDGVEIHQGREIDIALLAGTYNLKIVATTTTGKSTSREALLVVDPLASDPSATTKEWERLVTPGGTARLYGTGLDKVKSVVVAGQEISTTYNAEGGYIEYAVPSDLPHGANRVIMIAADGSEYGADEIVSTTPTTVTSGAKLAIPGEPWILGGIGLDKVTSLKVGDTVISEFTSKTATEIILPTPELPDGPYTLTGTTSAGALEFYMGKANPGNALVTEVSMNLITAVYVGHQPVMDWGGSTFSIAKERFVDVAPGSKLEINYSINRTAEYSQMQTTTGWWTDLPGTEKIEMKEDGVKVVELTQESLDLIQAQDGFLCVGHGYYVDMVTIK